MNSAHHLIPTRMLRDEGWSLERQEVQVLLEKIRNTGVPLRDYAKAKPLRGVLTGLNEAFIIDTDTRDRLVREDSNSDRVIRPILRGRDAARWKSRCSNYFLITIASSENVDWPWSKAGVRAEEIFAKTFSAIHAHFLSFREALIKRQDQGRFFWELRSCDHMDDFGKPKIIWQDLAYHSRFSFDPNGLLTNDLCFWIASTDLKVLAALNSPLMWWLLARTVIHGKDEVLRLKTIYMEGLPIPEFSSTLGGQLEELVGEAMQVATWHENWEVETHELARGKFNVPPDDQRILQWMALPAETFAQRTFKLIGVKKPSTLMAEQLSNFQRQARARQVELLTRQLEVEKKIAGLVEDAYGLTPEERVLLRKTWPVRAPLDVLEARILGGEVVEDVPSEA